jgi:hypothetical protein
MHAWWIPDRVLGKSYFFHDFFVRGSTRINSTPVLFTCTGTAECTGFRLPIMRLHHSGGHFSIKVLFRGPKGHTKFSRMHYDTPQKKVQSTHPYQPRTVKCGLKPKGSRYMRETVENGWLRQVAITNNFQTKGNRKLCPMLRFWQTDFCMLMVRRCRCGLRYRASGSRNARAGYYHQLALHSGRQPPVDMSYYFKIFLRDLPPCASLLL